MVLVWTPRLMPMPCAVHSSRMSTPSSARRRSPWLVITLSMPTGQDRPDPGPLKYEQRPAQQERLDFDDSHTAILMQRPTPRCRPRHASIEVKDLLDRLAPRC